MAGTRFLRTAVLVVATCYAASYFPYALLIRSAGSSDGELSVLPVYSVACFVTLALSCAVLKALGRLPEFRLDRDALESGVSSAFIMYAASAAYMAKAPPVASAVLMKGGTIVTADVLDRKAGRRRNPGVILLALAAILVGWVATSVRPVASGASKAGVSLIPVLLATAVYVAGWYWKQGASGRRKGDVSFLFTSSVVSVCTSLVLGAGALALNGGHASWGNWRVWAAGVASEGTGVFGSALLLLPAAQGTCVVISRGASVAAGALAQAFRERVTLPELFAVFLAFLASVLGGSKVGNVSRSGAKTGNVVVAEGLGVAAPAGQPV